MNSPLGKYGQVVAAVVAVGVIGAYVVANLLRTLLALDDSAVRDLKELALIAMGAVFTAAAVINGVKAPITSAHDRIDKIEQATGVPTHGAYVPPAPTDPPA